MMFPFILLINTHTRHTLTLKDSGGQSKDNLERAWTLVLLADAALWLPSLWRTPPPHLT